MRLGAFNAHARSLNLIDLEASPAHGDIMANNRPANKHRRTYAVQRWNDRFKLTAGTRPRPSEARARVGSGTLPDRSIRNGQTSVVLDPP